MTTLIPVILCGGSGTRLWPLSRVSQPKQFLTLTGGEHSLLQDTALRLQGLPDELNLAASPILVTHNDHRFLVAGQIAAAQLPTGQIVLEPTGRNTAPALTLAALQAQAQSQQTGASDPVLLAMPADHIIVDRAAFHAAVVQAHAAALHGDVVTFGIVPDHAETGYGYIQHAGLEGDAGPQAIVAFVEKPDLATAQSYVQGGQHLWNSGLFMLRASVWLKAIGHYRPDILQACQAAMNAATHDLDFVRPDAALFTACPSESIDYAVMEHLPKDSALGIQAKVIPLQAGWSDVGAWDALHAVLPHDAQGNAAVGEALMHNTEDSLVFATSRLVATAGLKHIAVVETPDAVLVVDLRQTQDVKNIVARLQSQGHALAGNHRKVHRPWGWYDSIDSGERFQVKRIVVNPGASLSLQMHHHRAEHWIVVKGTAEVTNGEQVLILSENQSTYIPLGQTHRLANPGKVPLEIIEVQSGSYLGEDDIVRFNDTYGRA
jgi:mannose-1-phosphate guanylyltransferase/mannose-6-phosphate isomerase